MSAKYLWICVKNALRLAHAPVEARLAREVRMSAVLDHAAVVKDDDGARFDAFGELAR